MREILNVQLSHAATADVQAIIDYLAAVRGRDHAIGVLTELMDRIGDLSTLPLRGVVPKELQALGETDFRQILFGRYRVIYQIADARVVILLVADGRRDMQRLLRARLLGAGDS